MDIVEKNLKILTNSLEIIYSERKLFKLYWFFCGYGLDQHIFYFKLRKDFFKDPELSIKQIYIYILFLYKMIASEGACLYLIISIPIDLPIDTI